MRSNWLWTTIFVWTTLLTVLPLGGCKDEVPQSPAAVARPPRITPDYTSVVIPPNIAPLNFVVDEPGEKYYATIRAAAGPPINVSSSTGKIIIPPGPWKNLLGKNLGQDIHIDICVKAKDGSWNRYQTISNTIADAKIDPYLAYRFMMPSSYFPKQMQICQRNLENFEERVILDTGDFGKGCANCHSFVGHHPEQMLIGMRSTSYPSATIYAHDGVVEKIGAKFGYTAWHPSGKIVAYSVNKVKQFFHSAQPEIHDVVDLDSAIFYYDVEDREIRTAPAIADKQRLETYPAWTPDGKTMYFNSAPLLWTDLETVPPQGYREVRYDLMRVSYDVNTDSWGQAETVLSAAETGRSILLPRISPDGRFLVFCMTEYGCFPIYQPSSDLYIMDLSTGKYRQMSINSEYAEGWHSWSSNSRWLVFSSKRQGGLYTRPSLSYVDAEGHAHKPFVLPQEDPTFYQSCTYVYSIPELLTGPVTVDQEALVSAIVSPTQIGVNSITGATPQAGSTDAYKKGVGTVQ